MYQKNKRLFLFLLGGYIFLFMLIFKVSQVKAAEEYDWRMLVPGVTDSYLTDLWVAAPDNIYVVGININGAMIGHFDGQDWSIDEGYILGEPSGELNGIWGSSPTDIFAVGGVSIGGLNPKALILHFDGTKWSVMDQDFSNYLLDVQGNGPDDVYAVGEEGLIIHWDGYSWTQMDNPAVDHLYGIWVGGPDKIYAVGGEDVLKYSNGIWTVMPNLPNAYLLNIWGSPNGDLWAVGSGILRYHNGYWSDVTPINLPSDFWLFHLTGRSDNDLMVVGVTDYTGEEGLILRYNGSLWQRETGRFPGCLNSGWMDNQGKAMIVGGNFFYDYTYQSLILTYDQNLWTIQSSESYEGTFYQVWAYSDQDSYVVGGHPEPPDTEYEKVFMAHYDGSYWTPIQTDEHGLLFDIWGSSDHQLFAVGGDQYVTTSGQMVTESKILHSVDGLQWDSVDNEFKDILQDVWGSSSEDVYAVGESIYHYDGEAWVSMELPAAPAAPLLNGIWGTDSGMIFAVGEDLEDEEGKAVIFIYNGQEWVKMEHNIYDRLYKVWGTSFDNVYAVGEVGLYHYDGQEWISVDCPPMGGYYAIWGTSPSRIFVTGKNGILHYNGQEWIDTGFLVDPFSPLLGISGTSSEVLVAGDFGTILSLEHTEANQQKILLREGWNLISFQVKVAYYDQQPAAEIPFPEGLEFRQVNDLSAWLRSDENSPIRDAAQPEKAGDWQRITSMDKKETHLLDKNVPAFANDLHYLAAGYGYCIKMNKPGYLIMNGEMLSPSSSLTLHQGWNLIGSLSAQNCYYDTAEPPQNLPSTAPTINFLSVVSPVAKTVFSSLEGKYRRITTFDGTNTRMYDTQLPIWACDLHSVAPGLGYWVKMTEEGEFTLLP